MLSKKEEKLIKLAEANGKDSDLVILDEIDALEEKFDKTKEELEQKFDETVKEIKENVPNLDKVLETVKGKDGNQGEQGDKGEKGDKGDKGEFGIQGLKGDKGERGDKGDRGEQGISGIDGKNGDLKDLSPDEIRNSLELLKDDERLDVKAIKGISDGFINIENKFAESLSRIPRGGGGGNVEVFSGNTKVGSSQRLKFTGATITNDADGAMKIAIAGGGDMTAAVYDPASIIEQLVGLTATQTLTNKRLTSPKLNEDVAVTATATEVNVLDGVTATTAEINYIDGVTSAIQTQLNAKVDDTLTSDVTFGENTALVLDTALSADGKYCGVVETGTAGATLAFGDLCYLAAVDSRWELTDSSAAATSGDVKLGICVLAAAADGNATTMLLYGKIRADAVFPAFTISAPVHISETAGDVVVAAPTTTDSVTRRVGFANTADELFFCPSPDYYTHT